MSEPVFIAFVTSCACAIWFNFCVSRAVYQRHMAFEKIMNKGTSLEAVFVFNSVALKVHETRLLTHAFRLATFRNPWSTYPYEIQRVLK